MSPVEKLEAAIDLLGRMSVEGSDGAWYADWLAGGPALGWRAGVFNGVERIALCQERDAHLIATLHRTIGVQGSILRNALDYLSDDPDHPHAIYSWVADAIRLANAILGDDA